MKWFLVLLAVCSVVVAKISAADVITDEFTYTIPVWGDTVEIATTAVDTSGIVKVDKGGYYSATLWADSTGGAGVVALKLEYQIMQRDFEYHTAVAETTTTVHPVSEQVVNLSTTFQPVKLDGNWWNVIYDTVSLYGEREIAPFYIPVCEGVRFRLTGLATNSAYAVAKLWVRYEP